MEMPPIILESFLASRVPPQGMDELWSRGWRHFGGEFFRYSIVEHAGRWETVVPLRIDLRRFDLTKSQRRVLRKNADLGVSLGPVEVGDEDHAMFDRHKERFTDNVPDDLQMLLLLLRICFTAIC